MPVRVAFASVWDFRSNQLVAGRRTWSAVAVATEVRARKISVSTLEWYIRRLATMGQVWVLMCHFAVGAYSHEKGAAGASLSSPSLPADQVPVNTTHSMMLWPKWVVLITGSDRFCTKCCSSFPTITSRGVPSLRRKRGGFLITLVPGHHRPGRPGEFDGGDLGGAPRQQCGEPGPMPGAM